MFTGIVESVGTIVSLGDGMATRRLIVATSLPVERLPVGASIAVDGVCLTVVDRGPGQIAADLGPETLACTTLGRKRVGDRVHLERPLAVGDALDGHMVAGHVDGVGRIVLTRRHGEAREVDILAPAKLARYLVSKGSIAVDGVSLTINTVDGDRFGVTLVPHTVAVTALGERPLDAEVNLEVDLIAKHVDRLVAHYIGAQGRGHDQGRTRPDCVTPGRAGPGRLYREGRNDRMPMNKTHEGILRSGGRKFAIVASRFNDFIGDKLVDGALDAIRRTGGSADDVEIFRCPGALEIPGLVRRVVDTGRFEGVICIGVVIRAAGWTPGGGRQSPVRGPRHGLLGAHRGPGAIGRDADRGDRGRHRQDRHRPDA